jgi:hypothetical protein
MIFTARHCAAAEARDGLGTGVLRYGRASTARTISRAGGRSWKSAGRRFRELIGQRLSGRAWPRVRAMQSNSQICCRLVHTTVSILTIVKFEERNISADRSARGIFRVAGRHERAYFALHGFDLTISLAGFGKKPPASRIAHSLFEIGTILGPHMAQQATISDRYRFH